MYFKNSPLDEIWIGYKEKYGFRLLIDTPENFPNRLPPKKIQQIFLKDNHSFYSVGFSE
jgi:hypothetical protein